MKKIFRLLMGVACWMNVLAVCAVEKFEILPDLPEPLASAQASSISTTTSEVVNDTASHVVGQEPNMISVIFSLIFVILLIYATGIIYTKLNKVGLKTLKKQMGDSDGSRVTVVSTTPLGNNKTLHIVELDGKRMLIGASTNSIDLLKDLGSYPPTDINEGEFSKIEIPNIRIPKIEIPKIEFPNIGFTKAFSKPEETAKDNENQDDTQVKNQSDEFEISEIYEESADGIIDKLFTPSEQEVYNNKTENLNESEAKHTIDPEEYALYKKYL